jgi:predicted homoserine dehydrogenase-like protein
MIVDTALLRREEEGRPIRVGMVGAGATGRAIALQLGTPVPGIRLVGVCNRTASNGERLFREAGLPGWVSADSPREAGEVIAGGNPVLTDDPEALTASDAVDVIVEVTGTVDFAAAATLSAFQNGKHVVAVNAELDSLVGPMLAEKARAAGVVFTNTDGDEPGVAMTLLRYLRSLGLRPVAAGNVKGMVDHYRTPDTQAEFARSWDQDPRKVTSFADATKLSMETTVLANATGFTVGRRGMFGPNCSHVREVVQHLPPEQLLDPGLVDYVVGAEPHTGAFVVVYEEHPLKQAQLRYYKLGDGPFYVFFTPFHVPHLQIASTIARAAVHGDPTVAPLAGPVCEVVAVAKRDLDAGERLDGIGGFTCYGLIDGTRASREANALPIGLADGCELTRDVGRDAVVSLDDVVCPGGSLGAKLWEEQAELFRGAAPLTNSEPLPEKGR